MASAGARKVLCIQKVEQVEALSSLYSLQQISPVFFTERVEPNSPSKVSSEFQTNSVSEHYSERVEPKCPSKVSSEFTFRLRMGLPDGKSEACPTHSYKNKR